MLGVTIDTTVFAPPPPGSPKEAVYSFVDTLLEWREARDRSHTQVYTSRYAANVLMEGDLYPLRPYLSELLREAGVFEYDANTVAVVAEVLLNSEKIEDVLRISDVLVDGLTIEPDVFCSHAPAVLRAQAERCAVVLAVASRYCNEPLTRGHAIAIRATDLSVAIRVRGLLQDIEHERNDLDNLPMAPHLFEGSTLVCSSLHDFLSSVNAAEILKCATEAGQVEAAITTAWYQRQAAAGLHPVLEGLPPFRVGASFMKSLEAHRVAGNAGLAERILRAAVETICHEKLTDTHWLRTGRGGGDPQRMRGRDAAWRRDIDYEYHLHYWECEDGTVELASVVVHNDFSIPE